MTDPSQEPEANSATFAEMLDRVASSANTQKSILTDGRVTCSYLEIPSAIASIDEHFAEKGVGVEHPLAFECVNSVPGALTLLYLLYQGYSFLLLPPRDSRYGKSVVEPPIPRFCRFQIKIEGASSRDPTTHYSQPESFLRIDKNVAFSRERGVETDIGQKLFLRTSGSLGSPKMAVHSHTKLVGNALNCVERFRLNSEDRLTIPVPIFHMYGFGAALLPGVVTGASIDLQARSNILRYLERERQFDPNVAFLTPALCGMLLKARKSKNRYKSVVTAGDSIKKDTFLAFDSRFGCLLNLYGSTEMGAIAACGPDDPLELRAETAGQPMRGVEMRITETSAEPAAAAVGELWCKHAYGYAGYVDEYGQPILPGGMALSEWYETKDLGRIRAGGYVEVLGRCDHSVNRSGLLVTFAEIEGGMERIAGIERVAVVTKGESNWGKRIVAFCVPAQGTALLSGDQVRAACFDILPRYAVPDSVVVIAALPTLPNGKVDRPALVEMAPAGPSAL